MSAGQYTPSQGSYPTARSYSPPESWSERACGELSSAVERNPSGTLMTAFGIGLGVGTLLALSVAASLPKPTPKQRIRGRAEKVRDRAEDLGHRIMESIHDALHDVVPESLAKRF